MLCGKYCIVCRWCVWVKNNDLRYWMVYGFSGREIDCEVYFYWCFKMIFENIGVRILF